MPEMSVIIANWNGRHYLDDCLSALRRQTFRDFETILVDNGSTDASVEFVREQFPEVRVLCMAVGIGFAAANIAGYEQSSGKLIVPLNNDTEAHPRWLDELRNASLRFPEAGSFTSKMLFFDQRNRIDNCGIAMAPAGCTIDIGRDQEDGPAYSEFLHIFGASGGAVAYRREMLEDVGFFDPDFFIVYEDADLSFRAQLRGYASMFVPQAVIYHHHRATLGNLPLWDVFYSQRNIEFVYIKNMPLRLMLRYAPQRLLYELGSAVYFGRRGAGWTFVKAKASALRHLPVMLRKRKLIQMWRTVPVSRIDSLLTRGWLKAKVRKFFTNRPPSVIANVPRARALYKNTRVGK